MSSTRNTTNVKSNKKKGVTLSLAELNQILPQNPTPSSSATATSTNASIVSGSWADDLPEAPTGLTPSSRSSSNYPERNNYGRGGNYTLSDNNNSRYSDRPGRGPASNNGSFGGNNNRPGRSGYKTTNNHNTTMVDASMPVSFVDYNALPRSAPFCSFIGNLPRQVTSPQDLSQIILKLFQVTPTNSKIPTDRETGEMKGFAIVEFGLLEDLIKVLEGAGRTIIMGRQVRIDLAESSFSHNQNPHGSHFSSSNRQTSGHSSEFARDWRASARPAVTKKPEYEITRNTGGFEKQPEQKMWRNPDAKSTNLEQSASSSNSNFSAFSSNKPKPPTNNNVAKNPFGNAKPREINLKSREE